MKQNFFDHLDGGWGDVIANTYKEANEYLISIQATSDEGIPLVLDYLDNGLRSPCDTLQVNSIDIKMIHDECKYNKGKALEPSYCKKTFKGFTAYFYVWAENMLIDGMTVEDYFNKLKEEQHTKYRFAEMHKECGFYIGLLLDTYGSWKYISKFTIINTNKYNMYISEVVKELAFKHV